MALRYIIYSLFTLIISAYPEGAPGRGGSDGCCCSCLPSPNRTHEPQYWPRTTPPYPYVPGQGVFPLKRVKRPTKQKGGSDGSTPDEIEKENPCVPVCCCSDSEIIVNAKGERFFKCKNMQEPIKIRTTLPKCYCSRCFSDPDSDSDEDFWDKKVNCTCPEIPDSDEDFINCRHCGRYHERYICCNKGNPNRDRDGRENSGPCMLPFSGKFLHLFWNICLMPFLYGIFVNM